MVIIMIRIKNIKIRYNENKENILPKALKKINASEKDLIKYSIFKESLDLRKKDDMFYIYTLDLELKNESKYIKKIKNTDVSIAEYNNYLYPNLGFKPKKRPVIVGFGPAGMFAAIILAKAGVRPIVFERGKDADSRIEDINNLIKNGIINTNSNIQFGEGGAGTFSDGKLTTRIKDQRAREVIKILVKYGAPEEILYSHNPHIGTDRLVKVVKNIREDITNMGGDINFNSIVTDINIKDKTLRYVTVNNDYIFECDNLILSIGHSARDTFEMLYNKNIKMSQKPFAMGARIEHLQSEINKAQYGDESKADYFGPAEYKLTYTTSEKRGVYTFCMCPGGYVVPAASEEKMTAVNGMSYYKRDGKNANSAILVQVFPEDFKTEHPLSGMYIQRELEKKAFEMANGGYKAPAQTVGEFLGHKRPENFVKTTYRPNVTMCDLNELFPDFISRALKEAIPQMGKKLKNFDIDSAVLIAPESRSSSPVRIERDLDTGESLSANGIFPCGEGAGYAGGIVSAAVDGMRAAEKIINKIAKNDEK